VSDVTHLTRVRSRGPAITLIIVMKNLICKFFVIFSFLLIYNLTFNIENCKSQWVSYTLPYNGIAYTLGFYNVNTGVSCGHTFLSFNEKIYYTTNSGISWIQATYPQELRAIADIQFINATTIYACGAENVVFNNIFKANNDFISFPKNIRDRFLREGKREFFSEYKSAFIKSTNGGLNWQRGSQFDTTTGYIMDIHFFNANTGYALIDSNSYGNTKFCKTTNAGMNWQLIKLIDPNSEVEKMIFFDMNTGIAKGFKNGGKIYKTTNTGLNWTITNMPSQIDGITFFNSTTGIAIGITNDVSSNNIYKTTNAGNNWNVISTIPGGRLFNNIMSLPNTGTAFAIGNLLDLFGVGKINTLKTTNYGLNWILKEFNPKLLVYGLSLVDADNFFIGAGGYNIPAQILKSTNGGNVFVNQIENEIPSKYSLYQNYPNPFNPTTNIKIDIQKTSVTKMIIYDALGREVTTLVNEVLKAGSYEMNWDGSNYTSGVYFYRLNTGDYVETKKMLLMK